MNYQLENPNRNGFATYRKLDGKSVANSKTLTGMLLSRATADESFFPATLPEILDLEDLLKWLTGLLIHFDTSPQNYQKGDYKLLISVIVKSLIHLYKTDLLFVKSTEFLELLLRIDLILETTSDDINDLNSELSEKIQLLKELAEQTESDLSTLREEYDDLVDELDLKITDGIKAEYEGKNIPVSAINFDAVFNINCGSATRLI